LVLELKNSTAIQKPILINLSRYGKSCAAFYMLLLELFVVPSPLVAVLHRQYEIKAIF